MHAESLSDVTVGMAESMCLAVGMLVCSSGSFLVRAGSVDGVHCSSGIRGLAMQTRGWVFVCLFMRTFGTSRFFGVVSEKVPPPASVAWGVLLVAPAG